MDSKKLTKHLWILGKGNEEQIFSSCCFEFPAQASFLLFFSSEQSYDSICSSFLWSYTWFSYWIGLPVMAISFDFSVPETRSIGKEQQINWIAQKNKDSKKSERSLYLLAKSCCRSVRSFSWVFSDTLWVHSLFPKARATRFPFLSSWKVPLSQLLRSWKPVTVSSSAFIVCVLDLQAVV